MHAKLVRDFTLAGRCGVVTGAASGIGRETAVVLAEAGARLMLADIDAAGLARTAALVGEVGGAAEVRLVDVSCKAALEALADAAAALGDLRVWVNAAGILAGHAILETSEAELDRVVAVNLKGTYFGCAAAARVMRAGGGGAIVNISSAGADMPAAGFSAYAMTKSAVNMLTRTAAAEFGPWGIRVNSVAPGYVETPMVVAAYRTEDGGIDAVRQQQMRERRVEGSPLGLTGQPRDIALAILYLASDASRYMTGQVLRPNGGSVMP